MPCEEHREQRLPYFYTLNVSRKIVSYLQIFIPETESRDQKERERNKYIKQRVTVRIFIGR